MYDASCTHTRVNVCWKYLFSKLNHVIDQCPPTKDARELSSISLEQCCRVIWSKCTQLKEQFITVTDWGWDIDERGDINPLWTTLPKPSKACKEFKNCKCKNLCSRDTCTCKTYAIPCSEICRCHSVCEN